MNPLIIKINRVIFHLLFGFIIVGFFCSNSFAKKTTERTSDKLIGQSAFFTDKELREAMKKYLGIHYKRAGVSKKGLDCSGLVKIIYQDCFNVELPHQSSQQSRYEELEEISRDELRTGDLIFFSVNSKKKKINHVGLYYSDGKFIHSTQSKGVVVSELDNSYWRSKIVSIKSLANRDHNNTMHTFTDMTILLNQKEALFFSYEQKKFPFISAYLQEVEYNQLNKGMSLQRLEFGHATISDSRPTTRFSIFQEYFSLPDRAMPNQYFWNVDSSVFSVKHKTTLPYSYGLRLSNDLHPNDNLYIIPSISYLRYAPDINMENLPILTLDFTYGLYSSSDGWSFYTDLHLPIHRYGSSMSNEESDTYLIDLTLNYSQQVADNLQFIFSSSNFINLIPGSEESSSRSDSDYYNINFMVEFSF